MKPQDHDNLRKNFYMPVQLYSRLEQETDRSGLSESEVIRRAIEEHLDRREDAAARRQLGDGM